MPDPILNLRTNNSFNLRNTTIRQALLLSQDNNKETVCDIINATGIEQEILI
jgi:hypothetical protein